MIQQFDHPRSLRLFGTPVKHGWEIEETKAGEWASFKGWRAIRTSADNFLLFDDHSIKGRFDSLQDAWIAGPGNE